MPALRIAAAWVQKVATWFATLAFVAVVAAFIYGVFCRYGLGRPSDRADESAVILYLWSIMIGGALAVPLREHVAFDLLAERLGGGRGRWLEALGALIAGAVLLYALPTTFDYVLFLWREKTAAFQLPLNQVYFCFVIFQAAIAAILIARAVTLAAGRTAPEPVGDAP